MGLISLLGLGSKAAARTIQDVEAAIAKLASERETARAAVSAAMRERDRLLLIDGSDRDIAKLDIEADRHRLTLERADKAEPLLLAELAGLRTDAKARLWADLRGRYEAAALEFRDAMRKAVEKKAAMQNLHDEVRRKGFEHESRALAPPTSWVTPEALNDFEIALDRASSSYRPPAPPPKPVAPAPKPVAPKSAPKAAAPKPAPKPAKAPFVPSADERGEIQIRVLRGGLEVAGRGRRSGDVLNLPFADGKRVVESGGAEFEGALQ